MTTLIVRGRPKLIIRSPRQGPPGPEGPPGPAGSMVDVGSFEEPIVITDQIVIPSGPRIRIFITCDEEVEDPTIVVSDEVQEVDLYYVAGDGSLKLNPGPTLRLTGTWIPVPDSILQLQSVPEVKWTEASRNEMSE